METESYRMRLPRVSARLRLALSYAFFLVAAGVVMLVGVYIVVRYIPNYPLTAANPSDAGEAIASREEILNALVNVAGLLLIVLAAIGSIGGWFLAGWILRPLQRINAAARIAATGRLDHRIRLSGRNDEFRQLADTFDHMLDRLGDAFRAQERFAANASHELRTPLAINATLLDVARANPDEQDYAVLVERLRITNARAIGLTEALLNLASTNQITATAESVDLATIARAALCDVMAEAAEQAVQIKATLEDAPTVGDPTLLEQLAVNLFQNAIRHNSSPGHAIVATSQNPAQGSVVLRVENTGEVYTPEQTARLIEPFLRGTGRIQRADRTRGYGLGLALVSRIATIHGGTLALTPREGGGLIVVVTLPTNAEARQPAPGR